MDAQDKSYVEAPFTPRQVSALQKWQEAMTVHPLTCGTHSDRPLTVTTDALVCSESGCTYQQEWAPKVCLRKPPRMSEIFGQVTP